MLRFKAGQNHAQRWFSHRHTGILIVQQQAPRMKARRQQEEPK
jgi:hypothetical protein